MSEAIFDSPILNTPYAEPAKHWELSGASQPTSAILSHRWRSVVLNCARASAAPWAANGEVCW